MPARYAAYGANLVLLAVIVSGGLRFSVLADRYGGDPGQQWQDQALLWHSQLSKEGWDQMVQVLSVEFVLEQSGSRDVRLALDAGAALPAPADPHWLFALPCDDRRTLIDAAFAPEKLRRRLRLQTTQEPQVIANAVEELLRYLTIPHLGHGGSLVRTSRSRA